MREKWQPRANHCSTYWLSHTLCIKSRSKLLVDPLMSLALEGEAETAPECYQRAFGFHAPLEATMFPGLLAQIPPEEVVYDLKFHALKEALPPSQVS